MMNKTDLLQLVKHVHRKGQGIPDRRPMHPRREWLIGLFIFVVVLAAGTIFSLHLFETYKTIDQRTYVVDVTVPTYNQSSAKAVLAFYAERDAEYQSLRRSIGLEVEAAALQNTPSLTSTTWQWIESTAADTAPLVPTDPTQFVLAFTTEGNFSATTDCNALMGTFVQSGDQLTVGPIAATKKFCAGETLESTFSELLSQARSFTIENGTLTINLREGAGAMHFVAVEE